MDCRYQGEYQELPGIVAQALFEEGWRMTAALSDEYSGSRPQQKSAAGKSNFWPTLFIVSLALPMSYYIGPLRLSVYRIILAAVLVPCLIKWLSGSAGKIRSYDVYLMLYVAWAVLSLFVIMGFDNGFEPAGMLLIETLGAYMLARCYIRDLASFRHFVKTLFIVVVVLTPFAAAESVLNTPILFNFFAKFGSMATVTDMDFRLGFRRAQAAMEHPILFGVFCSCAFSLCFYSYKSSWSVLAGPTRAAIVAFGAFCSLSTGAYLSIVVQTLLIAWDKSMKFLGRRWLVLLGLFVCAYILVDALSNRSPFEVFTSYLTFNESTSYNRILIWRYGMEQVMLTPIFGIGESGDWIRPWWMHPSMDNYWLVIAVSYGLPAFVLFTMSFISLGIRTGKQALSSIEVQNARTALWITLVALSFSICSVHLWNATYVLFMFLIGSSAWIVDVDNSPAPPSKVKTKPD
jgi:O-Antigen ligase